MNLGERLYEMRKAKGLSQENVADILGVTRQTVSKWETNQTTPDFDKILPLCKLYEITTDELLTGEKSTANNVSSSSAQKEEQQDEQYERYKYNDNDTYTDTYNNAYTDDYANANTYSYTQGTADDSSNADAQLAVKQRKRFAILLSASIFLYILSPVPFFFSSELSSSVMLTLFFVIVAVATALIVFGSISRIRFKNKFPNRQMTKSQKLYKQITDVLSLVILAIYLSVSFLTHAWSITWILWIIYALICQIIKLVFTLKGDDVDEKE